MSENKQEILNLLVAVFKSTYGGDDVKELQYDNAREEVTIVFQDGFKKLVNVSCDSGLAMILDVTRKVMN